MIKNIFITTLIISAPCLLGMEIIWHNPNIKNDIHIDLAQRYFSHESICALALVNKPWNKFIQETAKDRRKYFVSQEEYKKARPTYSSVVYKQTTWHKHNSAYAYWIEDNRECAEDKKPITLHVVYLDGNTHICMSKSQNLYDVDYGWKKICEIYKAPFFDNKGDVHHYTYEQEGYSLYIIDYIMGIKKPSKKVRCFFDIMHKDNTNTLLIKENLCILENYPILLRAFMQSKYITEYICGNDYERIYHVNGVEIDEDYVLDGRFPCLEEVSAPYRRQYKNIEDYFDSSFIKEAITSRCIIKKRNNL